MTNDFSVKPVAYIETDFKEKFGIPRQSGLCDAAHGRIIFFPEYRNADALRGIEDFSHLWLIFDFSLSHRDEWSPTVRPPRLGGNTRVGVFATRSPFRPNPIGLSCVRLLGVEKTEKYGTVLNVSGTDLLDKTPILDIKPYIPFSDCHPDATGGFAVENMNHRLRVEMSDGHRALFSAEKLDCLLQALSQDPRPSYQDDGRKYSMKFSDFDVSFTVSGELLTVTAVEKQK